MKALRAGILAAATAAALAGCGASAPSPAPGSSRSPAPPASAAAVEVFLVTSEQVPFTGDVVTVTAQASPSSSPGRWLRLATVTVSFGDGSSASAAQSCTGGHQAPAATGLPLRHVYRRAGRFTARVTSARVCGMAGPPDTSAANATVAVLPTAPPASASWPVCTPDDVRISAASAGAGLGHVGVLFTVHNISATRCRLLGYPALRLVARDGRQLPTTVHDATAGTYLFPPVAARRVALPPGGYAAFELEYEDIPSGPQASEPYAIACPAAAGAEVILPGTSSGPVIAAQMAPCDGAVWVSPVIPGRTWVTFP
jgi:hypothetical protein